MEWLILAIETVLAGIILAVLTPLILRLKRRWRQRGRPTHPPSDF